MTNLDADGEPDADGDKMAMVEFVAVLSTFAFISTFLGDVRVVLHVTNLDVDGDEMASVDLVNVFSTFAFVSIFQGHRARSFFQQESLHMTQWYRMWVHFFGFSPISFKFPLDMIDST